MAAAPKSIVIIGAGAAGCFCAVQTMRLHPSYKVTILESGPVPMAKLALTGGGRCNISNTFETVGDLGEVYPRGARLMKRLLYGFSREDTAAWWESEGVPLCVQEDGRMFPQSQDAMQVVRTLESLLHKTGVELRCGCRAERIICSESGYTVETNGGGRIACDSLVLCAGGSAFGKLRKLLPSDIEITGTVPSLFTFRIEDEDLKALMGLSAPNATASIPGTSFRACGPILITDWGVSGPAVLRLSSHAAQYLAEHQYKAGLVINWTGMSEAQTAEWIADTIRDCPGRKLLNIHPEGIAERLWALILQKACLNPAARWSEMGSKGRSRLINGITASQFEISGKAAFKEEFVTCGGVSLKGMDPNTLESRSHKGLFFAGEVMDIDAVTGGFNLQAAWTTAMTVARNI